MAENGDVIFLGFTTQYEQRTKNFLIGSSCPRNLITHFMYYLQWKSVDPQLGGLGEEGALHSGQRVPHHTAGYRAQVSI